MNKYTEDEVLDIIKSCTDESPKEVLFKWNEKKANTPLDLNKWDYPYFVYTFPINVKGKDVGKVTIVKEFGISNIDNFMLKYLGAKDFEVTMSTFSNETYHWCYLTINEEFKLPKIVKGLHGQTFKGIDAGVEEFDFRLSYGSNSKEKDFYTYLEYRNDFDGYRTYNFYDNTHINLQIKGLKNGWSLGEKINENIQNRLNQNKDE